ADGPAAEESLRQRVRGRDGLGEDGAEAGPGVLAGGDEGGRAVGGIEIVSHSGSPFKVGGGRRGPAPAEGGGSAVVLGVVLGDDAVAVDHLDDLAVFEVRGPGVEGETGVVLVVEGGEVDEVAAVGDNADLVGGGGEVRQLGLLRSDPGPSRLRRDNLTS